MCQWSPGWCDPAVTPAGSQMSVHHGEGQPVTLRTVATLTLSQSRYPVCPAHRWATTRSRLQRARPEMSFSHIFNIGGLSDKTAGAFGAWNNAYLIMWGGQWPVEVFSGHCHHKLINLWLTKEGLMVTRLCAQHRWIWHCILIPSGLCWLKRGLSGL